MTNRQEQILHDAILRNVDFEGILEDILEDIRVSFEPQDLYKEEQLKEWAESNGYVETSEDE